MLVVQKYVPQSQIDVIIKTCGHMDPFSAQH
jgi:hypothetical protein